MSIPLATVRKLGDALAEEARDELKETWDDLRQREVQEIEEAGKDLGALLVRAAKGDDVSRELLHAKARLASWTWVGADRVRARWQAWLKRAAKQTGEVLAALADGLL